MISNKQSLIISNKYNDIANDGVEKNDYKQEEKTWWKKYKSCWRQDVASEFNRIITAISCPAKEKMLKMYEQGWGNSRSLSQGIMLGHALEIKARYSETHHTFIHGQKLGLWVVNQLTKELAKIASPNRDLSLYHFMRIENNGEKIGPLHCIKHAEEINDHKNEWRNYLISCDAYFFNERTGESVDYFVKNNTNVLKSIEHIVRNIISEYCEDSSQDLLNEIISIIDGFNKESTIGIIYTISIPKLLVDKTAYLSHPMGEPCQCSKTPGYMFNVLNKHQRDKTPSKLDCENAHHYPIPQYRICTDMLNTKDHRIFCLMPVDKQTKLEYKSKIRCITKKIFEKASQF